MIFFLQEALSGSLSGEFIPRLRHTPARYRRVDARHTLPSTHSRCDARSIAHSFDRPNPRAGSPHRRVAPPRRVSATRDGPRRGASSRSFPFQTPTKICPRRAASAATRASPRTPRDRGFESSRRFSSRSRRARALVAIARVPFASFPHTSRRIFFFRRRRTRADAGLFAVASETRDPRALAIARASSADFFPDVARTRSLATLSRAFAPANARASSPPRASPPRPPSAFPRRANPTGA